MRVPQACAQGSEAKLRVGQLGNISAKTQKDIATVLAFPFQLATSASHADVCLAGDK